MINITALKALMADHLDGVNRTDQKQVRKAAERITADLIERLGHDNVRRFFKLSPGSSEDHIIALIKLTCRDRYLENIDPQESWKRYSAVVAQIPEVRERFRINDPKYILFHQYLAPPVEEEYIVFYGQTHSILSGPKVYDIMGTRPLFGVAVLSERLTGEQIKSNLFYPEDARQILRTLADTQPRRIDELVLKRDDIDNISPELWSPLSPDIFRVYGSLYHTTNPVFSREELSGETKIGCLLDSGVFGFPNSKIPTYLSGDESMSLCHQVQHGTASAVINQVIVDPAKLCRYRSVFMDPEGAHFPFEVGRNFVVGGGIPYTAIKEVRTLETRNIFFLGD